MFSYYHKNRLNDLLKFVIFLQEKYREALVKDICLFVKSILLSN